MSMDKKRMLAITAAMEGQQTVLRNIGKKVKVSQMELICLCTFAEIGIMSVFSELEGEAGEKAAAELDALMDAIRKHFAAHGQDGLNRLMRSTVALLRSPKFHQYIPTTEA